MPRGRLRRAQEINQQVVNPCFPDKIRELGLAKIICTPALRLNKALIAQCMMVGTAAVHRDLGKHYEQNRVSYRGGCVGDESPFVSGIRQRGEMAKSPPRCGGSDLWGGGPGRPPLAAPPPPPGF